MSDLPVSIAAVTEDTPCRRCGYNLKSLLADAKCPECGTAVADSLRGNLLCDADPEWVQKLSFGVGLKLWNIVVGIPGSFVAWNLARKGFPRSLPLIVTLAGTVIGLWATFVITTQEPRIALQDDPERLRRALRMCAVLAFLGTLLSQANAGVGPYILDLLGWVLSLAGVFVMWGQLCYFRRFADRIPDPKLRKSTTMLMWIAPGTLSAFLAATFTMALLAGTQATTPPGGGASVAYSTTAPGLAAAIKLGNCFFIAFGAYLFFWYLRILLKYRKAFGEALSVVGTARPIQAS